MTRTRRGVAALLVASLAGCGGGGAEGEEGGKARRTASSEGGCYSRARLSVPAPDPERAVFVVVDQTTGLDDRLRVTVRDNLRRLLGPGTSYTIATFSAYGRGNYAQIAASGEFEAPLGEEARSGESMRRLEQLDGCLSRQGEEKTAEALRDLDRAMLASAQAFTHSEIMASLGQLSQAVRASPAREKMVILVSDLLEHSDGTTFYRDRGLRLIDPQAELRRAQESGLVADFGDAAVAVVGAGLLAPGSGGDAVRNRPALHALRSFWQAWFERSNAEIAQYGEPDLVTPLQWAAARGAQRPSGG